VRVYLEGRPVEGLRVSAGREGLPPHTYTATAVTAEDGTARIRIDEPGLWFLRTFAIRPRESPEADWESFWASMTFRVAAAEASKRGKNVAIVIHEGVELLDFAGPGEVFESARLQGAAGGEPWFHVYTVAPSARPVVSQRFLTVRPEHTIENCPMPDILVVPGGATSVLLRDEAFMDWFRRTAPRCEIVMSVCTGAFVLAEAGLLEGVEATTHWSALDSLRREFPAARVVEGRRFVDAGRIVTTAGVSAGIDGALHVVARLLGREVAERTARYMEYEWRPDAADARVYSE
jgi:transcriptional regulator GlxA family with amidase domain